MLGPKWSENDGTPIDELFICTSPSVPFNLHCIHFFVPIQPLLNVLFPVLKNSRGTTTKNCFPSPIHGECVAPRNINDTVLLPLNITLVTTPFEITLSNPLYRSRFTKSLTTSLSEGSPLQRLLQPPIRIARHLHPQTNQNLLHSHVSIPILRGGDLGINDFSRLGIDAVHVYFRYEADFGRDGGVRWRDGDAEFVEAGVV